MCNHVYMIMHVNDPKLSVVGVGHCAPLAGFCLSIYSLHVLTRDVNMVQTNKQKLKAAQRGRYQKGPHWVPFFRAGKAEWRQQIQCCTGQRLNIRAFADYWSPSTTTSDM